MAFTQSKVGGRKKVGFRYIVAIVTHVRVIRTYCVNYLKDFLNAIKTDDTAEQFAVLVLRREPVLPKDENNRRQILDHHLLNVG